ncbi:MAG: hypothetical protein J4O01_07405, partial [Chloroflexi bacterium]|nr:hypothetical protein [Chloroflexota bacterium]
SQGMPQYMWRTVQPGPRAIPVPNRGPQLSQSMILQIARYHQARHREQVLGGPDNTRTPGQ